MKSKKEVKDSYKGMKFQIGVFQIRNTVNNKIYIESSTHLIAIWNRHKFQLNSWLHPNKNLQKEWTEFERKEVQTNSQFVKQFIDKETQRARRTFDVKKWYRSAQFERDVLMYFN